MKATLLSLLSLVVVAPAGAQTDPAAICGNILADAGRNLSVQASSSDVLNSVFDKSCDQSGTTKASAFNVGLDVVVSSIPVGLTLGSSDAQTSMRNFCRNYATTASSRSRSSSLQSTVVDKALDTVVQCMLIARTGSSITHNILNQKAANIYLKAASGNKVKLQGVATTGNLVCRTNNGQGGETELNLSTNMEFDGNLVVSCQREAKSELAKTNQSPVNSPATLNALSSTAGETFDEATVTVSTNNGPYAFLWPRATSLPVEDTQKILEHLAELRNTITVANSELSILKGRTSVVNRVTSSRTLGVVYQNTSGKTKVVMVSAQKSSTGNTMFANVANAPGDLPNGDTGGGNAMTMVAGSFINNAYLTSVSFVVPNGYYYQVSTDGGSVKLTFWNEVDL